MKRLWLLCPVESLNKLTIFSGKVKKYGERLVSYIEKKQDKVLVELEHELHADKE